MENSLSSNKDYSTTQLLKFDQSLISKNEITPKNTSLREGGLRVNGYFKFNHKKYGDEWFVYRRNNIKEKTYSERDFYAIYDDLPLITVVTVVFNGVDTIEATIKSVIEQSYPNIEYIIIDGESTDGTLNIIEKYNSFINYWKSEKDCGIYDAMNKALIDSTGDWVIFMGADDKFASPHAIECSVSSMKNKNAVYYGNVILSQSCQIYSGKFNRYKIMQQNICHQSIFYPVSVYIKNTYNTKYKMLADYKYNLDLYGSKVKFIYLPIVITIFNEAGMSSNGDDNFKKDKTTIIRKSLGVFFYLLKTLRNFSAAVYKGFK